MLTEHLLLAAADHLKLAAGCSLWLKPAAAMRLGATDFVAKPFTPTELVARLNALGLIQKTNNTNE